MPKATNSPLRNWLLVGLTVAVAAPSPIVRLSGAELTSGVAVAISGLAILSAAFLLTWISEAAERDVSRGLALALIALIAVLPEYAVDLYFAWTAPDMPQNVHFATANMTGANRLLVGFAWPTLVPIFWLRTKKTTLGVRGDTSLGLVALGAATLYSFSIPLRGHLSLLDTAVLMSIFAGYMYIVSRAPSSRAGAGGAGAHHRDAAPRAAPGHHRAALSLRRGGSLRLGGALRRRAGGHRQGPGHQRVPAGPVAGAAGVGGA